MDHPISIPSEQGVAPEAILAFLDALEADPKIEPHGLIMQRHGHRIAEGYWAPHTADRSRLVYSLSKTFTRTTLALQLGEGRLTLDDLVRTDRQAGSGASPYPRRALLVRTFPE
jgi:CubicO group peptidase (beta-lactamase class C family)